MVEEKRNSKSSLVVQKVVGKNDQKDDCADWVLEHLNGAGENLTLEQIVDMETHLERGQCRPYQLMMAHSLVAMRRLMLELQAEEAPTEKDPDFVPRILPAPYDSMALGLL